MLGNRINKLLMKWLVAGDISFAEANAIRLCVTKAGNALSNDKTWLSSVRTRIGTDGLAALEELNK